MPKRSGLIIAVLVAILIIGAVAYTQFGKKSQESSQGTPVSQQQEDNSVLPKRGTIASLLGSGRNVMCKMSFSDENGSTSGTSYIAGQRVRSDFTVTTSDGQTTNGSMIYDGEYSYIWNEGEGKGTKFKIDMSQQEEPETNGDQAGSMDLDQEVDLDCSAWSVDSSKFTPPSDIEFTDFSSMMQQQPQSGSQNGQAPAVDSSVCDQITDPAAKAACEQYAQ
jgi:hypothetical protein